MERRSIADGRSLNCAVAPSCGSIHGSPAAPWSARACSRAKTGCSGSTSDCIRARSAANVEVRSRLVTARTVVLAIVVLPARVHAQPAESSQRDSGYIGKDIPLLEIDDCRPAPPVPEDQLRRIVSEHYQRGEVLYVQGYYPGAVEELVASYCLIPYYTILKDIGQAYERELDYEKAIAYLQRYALAVPKDAKAASTCAPDPQDDKRNVLARITVLERQQAKILINTEPSDTRITLS